MACINYSMVLQLTFFFLTSLHLIISNIILKQFQENETTTPNSISYTNDLHIKRMKTCLIDYFACLVMKFYFHALEQLLCAEKKRLGVEQFAHKQNLNALLRSDTYHKSMYICCFEVLYNFTSVKLISTSRDNEHVTTLNVHTSKLDTFLYGKSLCKLKFPWSVERVDLCAFDFMRIIELFVRTTTVTSTSTPSHNKKNENAENMPRK